MINVEQLFDRIKFEDKIELSSFELMLIIREISYGTNTKFDEYLEDWVCGRVESPYKKHIDQQPKNKHDWSDLFCDD